MFQGPVGPPPIPPIDPELVAKYSAPQSFWHRFQGTLIVVGILILLLVGLSVIGRFL
jgi:hypothetical protein